MMLDDDGVVDALALTLELVAVVDAAHVDTAADTFLDLPGFGKGFVFINGFALGRFWEIGPQKRLYIPAPLLREGKNDLLIIETEGKTGDVLLCDEPDLG